MPHSSSLTGAYAILGGSFDPIHNGHLYLAKEVLALTPVEKVILIPSFRHNFKGNGIRADFDTRLLLAQEAVDHFSLMNFICQPAEDYLCPIEVWDSERGESGYSSDLLRKLQAQYPQQRFAFIIGADNLAGLSAWHDYTWLKENLHFIILPRPGFDLPPAILAEIKHTILDIPLCSISSSAIRAQIASGESISESVPQCIIDKVLALYRSNNG